MVVSGNSAWAIYNKGGALLDLPKGFGLVCSQPTATTPPPTPWAKCGKTCSKIIGSGTDPNQCGGECGICGSTGTCERGQPPTLSPGQVCGRRCTVATEKIVCG